MREREKEKKERSKREREFYNYFPMGRGWLISA
jgi:hypothetical protein